MRRRVYCIIASVLLFLPLTAQPILWSSRGVGGGGALFAPSINPANTNEFYVGCDMSELFRTTDFGTSFVTEHFQKIQGGHNSKVQFTIFPDLRYCIHYANDQAVPVRSTDGGTSWQPLSGNPDPSEETFSITVDYANPQRVLISYYSQLYSSNDSGRTFTLVRSASNSGAGIVISGVLFDGNSIYVGTNDGMLVSTNGGASFSLVSVTGIPAAERIFSFAGAKQGSTIRFFCLTGDASSIYVGLPGSDYWDFARGVYKMDYGSGVWTPAMNGIISGVDFPMFVAMAANDINTAYLGGGSSSSAPGILKTTNGGANWVRVFNTTNNQNIATGWSGQGGDRGWGYGECPFGIAVAPNDANRIVFSDFGFVHGSTNGGATWNQIYVSQADQNPIGSNTPVGKPYRSVGIENTTCWQVSWIDQNNIFACFSDIKGIRSTDAGNSWSFNYTGHAANSMYRIIKHPTNGKLYGATSNIHDMYQSTRLQDNILDANDTQGKIIYSTNGGAAWQQLNHFGHPVFWIAIDPTNTNRMYASVIHSTLGGIYITNNLQNDAGATWTRLPAPPRTEGHPASIVVLNDGTVVCSYSGRRNPSGTFTASSGVFVSTNNGTNWTDRSDNGMRYWTKDVVVDPHDATQNTSYVGVFSGWGGPPNGLGGLYKTTNRGQSWTRINALDRVTSCTMSPTNADEMYLTTEANGLWHSVNINSQSPAFSLVNSYPFRQPERVFFNPYNNNEIWVTSFGAGIKVGTVTGTAVEFSKGQHPGEYHLQQNYPNPFNPSTTIYYSLSRRSQISVKILNLLGQEVATLVSEEKSAGNHKVEWNAERVASGIYFYRLHADDFVQTRKMILLR